jgi:GNAT superfamily N-acetyltransferase
MIASKARGALDRLSDARKRLGLLGAAGAALNRGLMKLASLDVVQVVLLEHERMFVPQSDACCTMRFLTPAEVRRFAADPINHLSPEFGERADRGLDLCFAAIHGDQLASYGWYALHSIEAEHSAGTPVGLPADMAYMYNGFTHPDYRGRGLDGACMGGALSELRDRGVSRLIAFVYWSNSASLSSCERLGYRRLGLLAVGPNGRPVRVPPHARRQGVLFGDEAAEMLERRASKSASLSPSSVDARVLSPRPHPRRQRPHGSFS